MKQSKSTVNKPILETRNLDVFYPVGKSTLFARRQQSQILFDVSLTLQLGEITAIVGEFDSGNSTLGKALVRLVQDLIGIVTF